MRQTGFAYAQTRMQARYAARPSAVEWQMIETGRNLAQCLDAARRGAYAPAAAELARDSSHAAIETALRRAWASIVAEVAGWAPRPWRAALEWLAPLPHLQLITDDAAPELPGAELLAPAPEGGGEPAGIWQRELDRRLPATDPALDRVLSRLAARFLKGPPRPLAETAALAEELTRIFRVHAQEPAAAFAWLGLVALDLERLRGALLLARLFPSDETGEAA